MSKNIILDIRTKQEYCSGHICSAINVPTPLPPLTQNKINNLRQNLHRTLVQLKVNPNTPIYVYCKKGIRARRAKVLLRQMGMRNIQNIGGVEKDPLKSMLRSMRLCYCSTHR